MFLALLPLCRRPRFQNTLGSLCCLFLEEVEGRAYECIFPRCLCGIFSKFIKEAKCSALDRLPGPLALLPGLFQGPSGVRKGRLLHLALQKAS